MIQRRRLFPPKPRCFGRSPLEGFRPLAKPDILAGPSGPAFFLRGAVRDRLSTLRPLTIPAGDTRITLSRVPRVGTNPESSPARPGVDGPGDPMRLLFLSVCALAIWSSPVEAQWEEAPRSGLPSIGYREPDWKGKSPNDTALVFSCLYSERVGLFFRFRYEPDARQGEPSRVTLTRSDGRTLTLSGVWSLTSATLGTSWMTEVPYDAQTISFMTAGDWVELRTEYMSARVPLNDAAPLFSGLVARCREYVRERRARPNVPTELPIGPRPPRGRNSFD
jgi:hypothetical protein